VPLGVVLANTVFLAVSALTTDAGFMTWGWRIGFVLSVALIFIGLAIHHWHRRSRPRPRRSPPKADAAAHR
jgi:hypothetical protein